MLRSGGCGARCGNITEHEQKVWLDEPNEVSADDLFGTGLDDRGVRPSRRWFRRASRPVERV